MMLRRLRVFIIVGVLVQSCAKVDTPPQDSFQIHTSGWEETEALMARSQVNCLDTQACPSGVGMLVASSERNVSTCTAFLVDRRTVMTNSHCIPDDLKAGRVSCGKRLRVFFPARTDRPAAEASCEQVVLASRTDDPNVMVSPDYALIRLASEPPRDLLKVSFDGIEHRMRLQNVKVEPISRVEPFGEIRVDQCLAIQKSAVLPTFNHEKASVITLSGCEAHHGNSGSPLLDEKGDVRAIVQAYVTQDFIDTFSSMIVEPPEALNYGTNLACLPSFPDGRSREVPGACSVRFERNQQQAMLKRLFDEMDSKSESNLDEKILSWAAPLSEPFQWHGVPLSASSLQFIALPKCVTPSETWAGKYRGYWGYQSKARESVRVPVWQVKVGLNRYLQAAPVFVRMGYRYATVEFSPSDIHAKQRSRVKVTIEDSQGLDPSDALSFDLKVCR